MKHIVEAGGLDRVDETTRQAFFRAWTEELFLDHGAERSKVENSRKKRFYEEIGEFEGLEETSV